MPAARKCITHTKIRNHIHILSNSSGPIILPPDAVKSICFKLHCRINKRITVQFSEYNQLIYFRKTLYMFQSGFPSIIRSSKLHIQRQVRPTLLPAASLNGISIPSRLAAVMVWQMPDAVCAVLSSRWWTENPSETCRASYRNILWNVATFWLYSAKYIPVLWM